MEDSLIYLYILNPTFLANSKVVFILFDESNEFEILSHIFDSLM